MKVEIIDYTPNGIKKIARLSRATRKNLIEEDTAGYKVEFTEDFGSTLAPEYTQDQLKKDEKFVKALIKVEHYGILEHINFTFHVSEISRALTHQLVRHRIGFSYLQMSNRHAKPERYGYVIPELMKDNERIMWFENHMINSYELYTKLINSGVPVEDARYVLPPAFFTHISFTCNMRSLRHFLELRLAKGSQWEIRDMACKLFDIVYEIYPLLLEDLKELRDNASINK